MWHTQHIVPQGPAACVRWTMPPVGDCCAPSPCSLSPSWATWPVQIGAGLMGQLCLQRVFLERLRAGVGACSALPGAVVARRRRPVWWELSSVWGTHSSEVLPLPAACCCCPCVGTGTLCQLPCVYCFQLETVGSLEVETMTDVLEICLWDERRCTCGHRVAASRRWMGACQGGTPRAGSLSRDLCRAVCRTQILFYSRHSSLPRGAPRAARSPSSRVSGPSGGRARACTAASVSNFLAVSLGCGLGGRPQGEVSFPHILPRDMHSIFFLFLFIFFF